MVRHKVGWYRRINNFDFKNMLYLKKAKSWAAQCGMLALGSAALGSVQAQVAEQSSAPTVTTAATVSSESTWDLTLSPMTVHYFYGNDHTPVVLAGLTKNFSGGWQAGTAVFANSFGQPVVYAFAGQRYDNLFKLENWYWRWNAGIMYGYVGEYQNQVPYNRGGFSPAIVPIVGYKVSKKLQVEFSFLGNAALMIGFNYPLGGVD